MKRGGRYIRTKDGSVTRVEFTALPGIARGLSSETVDNFKTVLGIPPAHPLDHDDDGEPGGSKPATAMPEDLSAAVLADQADAGTIDFNTLRTNARRFLGNDVPRRKDDIIKALRELSDTEKD